MMRDSYLSNYHGIAVVRDSMFNLNHHIDDVDIDEDAMFQKVHQCIVSTMEKTTGA
jgi:hypothetical protein